MPLRVVLVDARREQEWLMRHHRHHVPQRPCLHTSLGSRPTRSCPVPTPLPDPDLCACNLHGMEEEEGPCSGTSSTASATSRCSAAAPSSRAASTRSCCSSTLSSSVSTASSRGPTALLLLLRCTRLPAAPGASCACGSFAHIAHVIATHSARSCPPPRWVSPGAPSHCPRSSRTSPTSPPLALRGAPLSCSASTSSWH